MTDVLLDREALALFEAYLEAEPADADAWLAERASGRADLLARVRTLLAAEATIALLTGGAVGATEREGESPERLGGYVISERIGAGGMGSVYLARRDRGDFEHLAAIKIIRPGLLSERLVERFRRERQILARLRHPNIAQLFDGGETDNGSPYIVMEYVDGQPLVDWAEANNASREERIDKLLQACSAVSFAHSNLIVHRDITPSNVLVTAEGVVKLIDFGIARPAGPTSDAPLPALAGLSSLQALSLTPGYAAPERMSGAEPTTAVDIFSLGKLAHKLLATGEPDRELDAIIARATAPDPAQRYSSVAQLAGDLTALRNGFPVEAMGSSGGYAFRKLVARHRRLAWAGSIALVLLLAAIGVTGVSWVRAEQARQAEARRFADVRALASYLLFDLNDRLRTVPGNTAARADLAAKAQAYLDTLSASPEASRDLKLDTARGFIRLAEIQNSPLERNLGLTREAQANLSQAGRMLADISRRYGDAPELAVASARIAAIGGLISFYEDTDAATSLKLLEGGKADLARVPEKERSREWRLAERDISRAEMERHSANEAFPELVLAADHHDAIVNAWPPAEQGGEEAAIEHAVAKYNRGLAWSLMDREKDGYPEMRAANAVFTAAEAKRPGNPDLLYLIGWSGADAYAAAARIDLQLEAEDLLTGAQRASRRLVAIQDQDQSARVLDYMVGEAYSQHLGNTGRFDEALAEQQRIVEAKLADMDDTSSGADVGWSELILAAIAKQGKRRETACRAFIASEAHFSKAEGLNRLVEFHRAFLPNLRANVALCRAGKPLSEFKPLR